MTKSSLSGRKRNPSFWRSIGAIFGKDLASELRTRFAVNTLLLFSVTSLTIVSFSTARTPLTKEAQSALLWIVIFFSAMTGLARSFVREEESGTADALRLTAPAESVFLGKFAFNCVLLLCVGQASLDLNCPRDGWSPRGYPDRAAAVNRQRPPTNLVVDLARRLGRALPFPGLPADSSTPARPTGGRGRADGLGLTGQER